MAFDERGSARGWRLPTWLVVICFILLAVICAVPLVLLWPDPQPEPPEVVNSQGWAPVGDLGVWRGPS